MSHMAWDELVMEVKRPGLTNQRISPTGTKIIEGECLLNMYSKRAVSPVLVLRLAVMW